MSDADFLGEHGSRFSWRAATWCESPTPEPEPATHTHGLDDIACPERLVGECVIEREVAHAVAIEREAILAMVVSESERQGMLSNAYLVGLSRESARIAATILARLAEAIRNGAHDGGAA